MKKCKFCGLTVLAGNVVHTDCADAVIDAAKHGEIVDISVDDLIRDLKHLSVETGSLACMGCGHEHECSIHGCALIRKAVSVIEVFGGAFTEDACVKLAASYLDVTPEQLRTWAAAHKEERFVTMHVSSETELNPKEILNENANT